MIPVELLTAHRGNVREDKQADQAFRKSVAAAGIVTPLEIAAEPGGGTGWWTATSGWMRR
ncbi:hypothetical protein [Actinomadura flavalba]|uniref:hypothetical protein n=1 Tax=Actinomadura flavalba TaxID=1120938 RepID=UPI0012DC4AD2|nr:hypothetical protein [Actinomadura flavalba]